MTRINLIDPSHLSDKHLLAENHEMLRPLTRVERAVSNGKRPNDFEIPERWKLGKGHELFFMTRLKFLHTRYINVCYEIQKRGFKVDQQKYLHNLGRFTALVDSEWYNPYEPSPEECYLNMARLARRSQWESTHLELISED